MIMGKRADGLAAVAAAVVQQDNVAAELIVHVAGWQVFQTVGSDLLSAAMRVLPPVVGIKLLPMVTYPMSWVTSSGRTWSAVSGS